MDRLYIFDTPDIPDGINGVTSDQVGTEKWFDMQGRRIDKPPRRVSTSVMVKRSSSNNWRRHLYGQKGITDDSY